MDLEEMGFEGVAQERGHRRPIVNTVMNFRFP
jgi:hypothetical protein